MKDGIGLQLPIYILLTKHMEFKNVKFAGIYLQKVMPDIEKIPDIAAVLGVSCDFLLKDDVDEEEPAISKGVGRLMQNIKGKTVRLSFFEDEGDYDLFNTECRILDFEGNWMKVEAKTKKGLIEKLIPVSSVLSVEIIGEEE